jgi:peptide/nickel transport system permease protein
MDKRAGVRESSQEPANAGLVLKRRKWNILKLAKQHPAGAVGAAMALLMVLLALLAPLISPYGMEEMRMDVRMQPPSRVHWLGTDQFGRDIFSRIIYGSRVSLAVGALSVGFALVVGVGLGSIAAFYGGWWDDALMRVVDILMAFPEIVLAIALIAIVGPSFGDLILVIGFTRISQFARLARGQVLLITRQEYVTAAHAVGMRSPRVLVRHVLPNVGAPIIVLASLTVATAINAEAAMSFLGIGIQPPLASWGTMVADGRRFVLTAPWIATFPGVAISLAILGFNLLGDTMRDVFDPRTSGL